MKKSSLIGLALIGVGVAYALSKQSPDHSANPSTDAQAIATDTAVGSGWADWIISAPTAELALARGNDVVQIESGLDLTAPVFQTPTDAPQVTGTFDARDAKTIVNTQPVQPTNPWQMPPNNAFPALINGVWVANPNQLEHLSHAWDEQNYQLYGNTNAPGPR